MFSTPILVFIFVCLIVLYIFNENKKRPPNFPPGLPILPVYGSYWFVVKENLKYTFKGLLNLHNKYKSDVISFYMGPIPCITMYKYDLVKEALNREEFQGRVDNIIIRNRGRGDLIGVFFADGQYWRDQRWFSLRNMRDFGFGRRDVGMEDTVADEIRLLLEYFQSNPKPLDDDVCTEKGIVKMPDILYGPSMNCIHHTLSTTHFEDYRELREVGRAATKFLNSIDATGNSICITPWLRFIAPEYFGWTSSFRENELLLEFARKVIAEHKSTFNNECHRDFIDVYLSEMYYLRKTENTNTFTDKQLEYLVVDYMTPAPVGIGHTLNYLFAYLILQPEFQTKIQNEIDRVVGRCRLPTLDDRKDMHYTEACLREIIRRETLVPLCVPRRCTKDTTFGGYFIPKDTGILPNLWGMHMDPEFWVDPEVFRPERFLDDNGVLLKKDFTLGFGAGKRLCAGETFARNTMFLFLAGIMQNFNVKVPANKPKPDLVNQINGITIACHDYWMEVVPRG